MHWSRKYPAKEMSDWQDVFVRKRPVGEVAIREVSVKNLSSGLCQSGEIFRWEIFL